MTDTRWQRLARLLEERRAEIRSEWVDRTTFARDNDLSYRTLSDLESARRDNYRAAWLKRVEHAYQWQPGSIQRVLDGADPVPIEEPASTQPDDEPGVIHDERGPRTAGLRLGERLRWQVLDEATLEYRLDYDDGSGAAMVVRTGTPREQVLEWLRADIEMARGMQ